MPDYPVFDEIEDGAVRAAHALGGLFHRASCPECGSPDPAMHPVPPFNSPVRLCPHPWHHHGEHPSAPQAPADEPVTLAPPASPEGEPVSLETLSADIKGDLTEGAAWVEQWIGRVKAAAPGIIETTEAVGNSTLGKLAEGLAGAVLPEPYEEIAVGFVKDLADKFGQPAQAATPAAPADPAQAAQTAGV